MSFIWGDGFDCYAATGDAIKGFWDSGTTTQFTLVAGRFAGSQAVSFATGSGSTPNALVKSSGVNDALHHIVLAFNQTSVITGSTLAFSITFIDASTNQCSVVFRSDGAILLTSGAPNGTALATYTGAVTANNTWFAFEIEVAISNTAGHMNVRKNGNTVNDFTSATNLNTRASANNYANKIAIGEWAGLSSHRVDDFLWRSDASTLAWLGDIRCFSRMPASDASVQWTPNSGANNWSRVSEAQQDGITSYVSDVNVGDSDLYNIASIAGTPASVVAVTTRGYIQKGDAGTRNAAVQLKSGATTVQTASTALNTTFSWLYRIDAVDPATSAAWTASGVNNCTVGAQVTGSASSTQAQLTQVSLEQWASVAVATPSTQGPVVMILA